MNFLGMGPGELMVILVLALIVFGPQKMPEIGRGLGKAIAEFRKATTQITEELNRELQIEAPPAESTSTTAPAASVPASHVEVPAAPPQGGPGEPLVLEIKPEAATGTSAPAAAAEAPPMAPVEHVPESPAVHMPAEETAAPVAASAPAEAAAAKRPRRARKPAAEPVEAVAASPTPVAAEEATPVKRPRRRKVAEPAEGAEG
ncbi:MAG TPA: twin-arginine translocase TatA/TatE family subunit [Chloroflexota bacterium]